MRARADNQPATRGRTLRARPGPAHSLTGATHCSRTQSESASSSPSHSPSPPTHHLALEHLVNSWSDRRPPACLPTCVQWRPACTVNKVSALRAKRDLASVTFGSAPSRDPLIRDRLRLSCSLERAKRTPLFEQHSLHLMVSHAARIASVCVRPN